MDDPPSSNPEPYRDAVELLREDARRLAALADVTVAATRGGDLGEALQEITDILAERFGWDLVACVSIDREADRFVCEAVTSSFATTVRRGYTRPLGSGVVGRVAATGEPLLLDDVGCFPDYVATSPGIRSELCVPVVHRGSVVAVLNLESEKLSAFHDQLPLLTAVARQVAGAIHLAQANRELTVANRQLTEANRKLAEAQDRIARLAESSTSAFENLGAWARSAASEIGSTLGRCEISLWEVDRGVVIRLSGEQSAPPVLTETDVRGIALSPFGRAAPGETLLPALSSSGEACGAVVVAGLGREPDETEMRLLAGLGRQLAGVLEMRRMRDRLAAAEARRHDAQERFLADGIETAGVCPSCGRCSPSGLGRCERDGAALDSLRLLPLRVEGRYRLIRFLGEGGMGTVYHAVDERLGRDVAIKVIRAEHFGDHSMRHRFEAEARAVARIRHPGVVALFSSGELPDGAEFLVFERLEGSGLDELLARWGAARPAQAARLLVRLAAALGAAHEAGIVHRDLKPQNVILVNGPDGPEPKVLDFGLAKTISADTRLTRTGAIVGTPAYMSPEQVQGLPVDARSDLYSLAAVVYEVVSGRRAIPGEETARLLANVLDLPPRPLSEHLATATAELDAAFALALEKEPARRPAALEAWSRETAELLRRVPALGPGWPEPCPAEQRW